MNTQHRCHWPGCPEVIPPRLWGCRRHWDMLPAKLKGWLMSTYRAGQEVDKKPSPEYVRAACVVRSWCKANPDPKLPPFQPGELVTWKEAGLFNGPATVVGCEIKIVNVGRKDRQVWFVRLADGSEWDAKSLVKLSD